MSCPSDLDAREKVRSPQPCRSFNPCTLRPVPSVCWLITFRRKLQSFKHSLDLTNVNLQPQAAQVRNAFRDVVRYVRPDLVEGNATPTKPTYLPD